MHAKLQQAIASGASEIELPMQSRNVEMILIPAGQFNMGSPPTEEGHRPSEGPVRQITISRPFYLGRHEITQAQYEEVMGTNPSEFRGDDLAIDQISHAMAFEFCRELSRRMNVEVTLPTEAQWEYACRAGTTSRFCAGDRSEDLDRVGWYRGNSGETVHEVGRKAPNAWGLYDMHGNVCEHCLDHLPSLEVAADRDPRGTVNERKGAMRGGGWMHGAEHCRAATRLMSSDRFGGVGIRIAINP